MSSLDNYHKSFLKSLYGTTSASGTTPTDALSSLLDPFASVSPVGAMPSSDIFDRPFSIGQLTGVPYKHADRQHSNRHGGSFNNGNTFSEYSNPLGAPGTPIGSMSPAVGGGMATFGALTPSLNSPSSGNVPPPKNPKLYKTELCRSWMDHGRCNYGERCQYAHGEAEKRPIPRHPKYKTEACQSFHQTGYCPYGPRCHFIHNETELLANVQNRQPSLNSQLSSPAAPTQGSLFSDPTPRSQPTGVPSSVLQRVYSLPGYGSAGESPAGSSNDSGSESPNGSFSPGLDLDDNGPFTTGFMSASPQKTRQQRSSLDKYCPSDYKTINNNPYQEMMKDLRKWGLSDALWDKSVSPFVSGSVGSKDAIGASSVEETPGRLPVFAQLSNPQ